MARVRPNEASGDRRSGEGERARACPRDAAALLARTDRDLPALAREMIPRAPGATPAFLADPDDPREHKPEWHQFGIITHTRRFVAALGDEAPRALRAVDPAIAARVDRDLARPLDDLARRDLLLIAGYWHDLGKFTTRARSRRGGWTFIDHARDSAGIVEDELGPRYGLTLAQTAHVARLAGLHFAPMELKLALGRGGEGARGADADPYRRIAARLGAEGYAVCCLFWADVVSKGETPRQRAQRAELWDVFARTLRAVDERLRPPAPPVADAAGA